MNKANLIEAYKNCVYIREVENLIASNYKKGLMRCPTHLSIGQELTPSILQLFLSKEDLAVSSHRSHAHYLAKGGNLKKMFDELHGLETGCSKGRGGSMHLTDEDVGFIASTAIVGNTIPIGVGLGESLSLSNDNNISIIYLGDGATEEGVFWESINYAAVRKLPCLFVIENNRYSVYTSLGPRQSSTKLSDKINGFGTKYLHNTQHDYKLLYDQFDELTTYCRNGHGPAVIEVDTFRYREHCGPNYDDDLEYRPKSEIERWSKLDCIKLLSNKILEIAERNLLQQIDSEIKEKVEREYIESETARMEKMEDFKK